MKLINDSRYFEPPDIHGLCFCLDCHEGGCHDDSMEEWSAEGCGACEMYLDRSRGK